MHDPNFPPNLSINPSSNPFSPKEQKTGWAFEFDAQQSAIEKYGIAGRVWEAAYTLTRYLENKYEFDPPSPFSHRAGNSSGDRSFTVLELGSGTGVVAANLSRVLSSYAGGRGPTLKASDLIIATDLENVCPLLCTNLIEGSGSENLLNGSWPEVLVHPLGWGNEDHSNAIFKELSQRNRKLSHIVCSDLVYFPELLAPLLRSLIQLTSWSFDDPEGPTVIISYKIRSLPKESPFWSAFGLWFDWEPVLYRILESSTTSDPQTASSPTDQEPSPPMGAWTRYHVPSSTYLFIAHRKPLSHAWSIPEDDAELLEGVGAHGNKLRKADERFEVMLLMDLAELGEE